jgi:hypothetical protein
MTSETDDQREARLRSEAARDGLALRKSRVRDPAAVGYSTYMLVDMDTDTVVAAGLQGGYGLNLDEVEEYLSGRGAR